MPINRWPLLLCLLPGVAVAITADNTAETDVTTVFLQAMDGPAKTQKAAEKPASTAPAPKIAATPTPPPPPVYPALADWVEKGLSRAFASISTVEATKKAPAEKMLAVSASGSPAKKANSNLSTSEPPVPPADGTYRNPFYLLMQNWMEHGEAIVFAALPQADELPAIQPSSTSPQTPFNLSKVLSPLSRPIAQFSHELLPLWDEFSANVSHKFAALHFPELSSLSFSLSHSSLPLSHLWERVKERANDLAANLNSPLPAPYPAGVKIEPIHGNLKATIGNEQSQYPPLQNLIESELTRAFSAWPSAASAPHPQAIATADHPKATVSQQPPQLPPPDLSRLILKLTVMQQNQRQLALMAQEDLSPATAQPYRLDVAQISPPPPLSLPPEIADMTAEGILAAAAEQKIAQDRQALAVIAQSDLQPAQAPAFDLPATPISPAVFPSEIADMTAREILAVAAEQKTTQDRQTLEVMAQNNLQPPQWLTFDLPANLHALSAEAQTQILAIKAQEQQKQVLQHLAQEELQPAQAVSWNLDASQPALPPANEPVQAESVQQQNLAAMQKQAAVLNQQLAQELATLHQQNADLTARLHDLNSKISSLQLAMMQNESLPSFMKLNLPNPAQAKSTDHPGTVENSAATEQDELRHKIADAEAQMTLGQKLVPAQAQLPVLAPAKVELPQAPAIALLPPPPEYISIKKYLAQELAKVQTQTPTVPDLKLADKPLDLTPRTQQLEQKLLQAGADLQAKSLQWRQELLGSSKQVATTVQETSQQQVTVLKDSFTWPNAILALAVILILGAVALLIWLLLPWLRRQEEEPAGDEEEIDASEETLSHQRQEPIISAVALADLQENELLLPELEPQEQEAMIDEAVEEDSEEWLAVIPSQEEEDSLLEEDDDLTDDEEMPQTIADAVDEELADIEVESELFEDEDEDDYDFMDSEDAIPIKLDLARAYLEMEDFPAVEQTLQSVLRKGNAEQKEEAQLLMEQARLAQV